MQEAVASVGPYWLTYSTLGRFSCHTFRYLQGITEPEKQIFDQAGAVDYFINELIRETMLHSPGMRIFVDADAPSYRSAQHIIRKSGEFSGISAASESEGALRLISRYGVNHSWQMELLSANGKSLWKRTVTLKN